MNLIESLDKIKDFRRGAGKRYPLTPVLLIVIISIISGKNGYREIANFAAANKEIFLKFFDSKRKKTPSHVTFREIIKGIDFKEVLSSFETWALQFVDIQENEWIAIDGKALGSTVTDCSNEYQNFVSLVSLFTHKKNQVLSVRKLETKKSNEIFTVREVIELLELKNVIFTLDALHCQKKL